MSSKEERQRQRQRENERISKLATQKRIATLATQKQKQKMKEAESRQPPQTSGGRAKEAERKKPNEADRKSPDADDQLLADIILLDTANSARAEPEPEPQPQPQPEPVPEPEPEPERVQTAPGSSDATTATNRVAAQRLVESVVRNVLRCCAEAAGAFNTTIRFACCATTPARPDPALTTAELPLRVYPKLRHRCEFGVKFRVSHVLV